jgi:hypothetical protein
VKECLSQNSSRWNQLPAIWFWWNKIEPQSGINHPNVTTKQKANRLKEAPNGVKPPESWLLIPKTRKKSPFSQTQTQVSVKKQTQVEAV